jgi:hypothetical protein
MKRLFGLVAVVALVSCGGEESNGSLASFFPVDNEVAGWTVNPPGTPPDVALDPDAAEALVDGDIAPFAAAPSPFTAFAMQLYINADGYTADVRIWQVADAAGCASMYDYLVVNAPTFSSKTWTDEAIGAMGRSADSAAFSWINACAGNYFLETKVTPPNAGTPDQTSHDEGVALTLAVAANVQ